MPWREHVTVDAVAAGFVIGKLLMTRETQIAPARLLEETLNIVAPRARAGDVRCARVRGIRGLDMTTHTLRVGRVVLFVTRLAADSARTECERLDVARCARDLAMLVVLKGEGALSRRGAGHLK